MRNIAIGLCLCLSAACASTLEANGGKDEELEPGFVMNGQFKSRLNDDGTTETIADAFSDIEWQRFDLDTAEPDDDDANWDLEFSRYFVRSNGGVTGQGGVEVAALRGMSFESVTAAPSDGFAGDREDGPEDTNTNADNVFNSSEESWFDYNVMTHQLSPGDVTFVVHSSEGSYFKLRFDEYYDKNGTPAQLRFRWSEIDPAPGS